MKLILTTLPSFEKATELAKRFVSERLVACAWVLPEIRSYYIWKGELQEDSEVVLVLKTPKEVSEKVIEKLKEAHPYEVPEIIAIDADYVLPEYLKWAKEVCGV